MYGKRPGWQTPEIAKQGRENYKIFWITRSSAIFQDLGWDTLEQKRSKQLVISVFKSSKLKNVYLVDDHQLFVTGNSIQGVEQSLMTIYQ